jgi:tRNA dimethylallyltransferase
MRLITEFVMTNGPPKRALLIAGPTASGKSALALRLAQERNGVIINADAMQVYRELRILTARPTPQEETIVLHRLYGHVPAEQGHSVAQWLAHAKHEIEACWAQDKLPIITGGTGLYFKALEMGLAELPPVPQDVRLKWRQFRGNLHEELRRRSSESAGKLRPNDMQRLVRELEVIEATGYPLSYWQARSQCSPPIASANIERMFLRIDRNELYARAEARFDAMLTAGALDEVAALLALNLDRTLPAMRAIGVPELSAYLSGELSFEQAIVRAKTATRHYIKRQLTWWRGQMKGWPSHDSQNSQNVLV